MNAVLMLCRNSLQLTKRAIGSVLEQDIPVSLYVIDNDSTDGTREFLEQNGIKSWRMTPAKGVSASWNFGLSYFFDTAQCDHVLVVNNDVRLRPDTYRILLESMNNPAFRHVVEDTCSFVTAVGVNDMSQLEWDGKRRFRPNPDFSCFLIPRWCWQNVGPFDEAMVLYASDADYHIRMYQRRVPAYTNGIPFYHYASGTLKTATDEERLSIQQQADRDRETFRLKWGCSVGSPEYYKLFE